jgi:high-affinity Fe2+/Pb2+ permease
MNKKANIGYIIIGVIVAIIIGWFLFWVLIPSVKSGLS